MSSKLLRARAGFTLAEVIIALTLTAVIGAAVTGVFVTQSRFFEEQEQSGVARGVSRGALNIITSELRMVEKQQGVELATARKIRIRTPYAMGLYCGMAGSNPTFTLLPSDPMMYDDAATGHIGYAYRDPATGQYSYVTSARATGAKSVCDAVTMEVMDGGKVVRMMVPPPTGFPALVVGTPVMLYQRISYEFKASETVQGIGLFRTIEASGTTDELVAPFDTTAAFAFYVNDAATADTVTPSSTASIAGIELRMNGVMRSGLTGKAKVVPMTTSVFFRNRLQ